MDIWWRKNGMEFWVRRICSIIVDKAAKAGIAICPKKITRKKRIGIFREYWRGALSAFIDHFYINREPSFSKHICKPVVLWIIGGDSDDFFWGRSTDKV